MKREMGLFFIALAIVIPTWGHAAGIPNNVFSRAFFIKWGNDYGTAFTIDYMSKQYLVTAKHVVKGITSGQKIEIYHEKHWKPYPVEVVGLGTGDIDIAVLTGPLQLSPALPLPVLSGGPSYGQQVSFLGFPFGREGGGEHINNGYPMPFVKTATLSAAIPKEGVAEIYLDAHVNQGFSGEPHVAPGRSPADGHSP